MDKSKARKIIEHRADVQGFVWYLVQTGKSQPCWKASYDIDEWVMLEYQNRQSASSLTNTPTVESFTPDSQIIPITPGVVWLHKILAPYEQIQLFQSLLEVAKTLQIREPLQPDYGTVLSKVQKTNKDEARNNSTRSNFKKLLTIDNSERTTFELPQLWYDFTTRAATEASKADSNIPADFHPNFLTSFLYDKNGRLKAHVDKIDGWITLFSLGCSTHFWIKGKSMFERKEIVLESGDVLMFDGAAEADVLHGIDSIIPNSGPSFIPELKDLRISLQFRGLHYVSKKVRDKLRN